jgi:type IV pilus assembly protein PilV
MKLSRNRSLQVNRVRSRERGSTLLEILITMLIVSFALLGIAGMQLASVRYQQTAHLRSTAATQIEIMAERIRTNSSALSGATAVSSYLAPDDYATAATIPADPGCSFGAGTCTAAQSAQLDLREWRQMLATELPGGRGALSPVTNTTTSVTSNSGRIITVMWSEKAQDSDDQLGAAPTDTSCPWTPRVGGIRCLSVSITP